MDEKLWQAYLFDFYGELLNERQRQIYEDFTFHDLSLGEIAGEEGISRQGVADMVKRCERKLESYEQKLHLVEKFMSIKSDVKEIYQLAESLRKTGADDTIAKIEVLSNQILEKL